MLDFNINYLVVSEEEIQEIWDVEHLVTYIQFKDELDRIIDKSNSIVTKSSVINGLNTLMNTTVIILSDISDLNTQVAHRIEMLVDALRSRRFPQAIIEEYENLYKEIISGKRSFLKDGSNLEPENVILEQHDGGGQYFSIMEGRAPINPNYGRGLVTILFSYLLEKDFITLPRTRSSLTQFIHLMTGEPKKYLKDNLRDTLKGVLKQPECSKTAAEEFYDFLIGFKEDYEKAYQERHKSSINAERTFKK